MAGDVRPPDVLAHEFLGEGSPDELRTLVRGLPLAHRRPNLGKQFIVACVAVVLLLSGAAMLRATREPPPPAFVWVLLGGDDLLPVAAESVAVRPERFGTGEVVEVGRRPQIRFEAPHQEFMQLSVSPRSSRRWIGSVAVADSGVTELFLVDNGRTRRMTFTPGDDIAPSWSPDGGRIVFATSRWHPSGQTDLAILDPETGDVTRLTGGMGQSGQRVGKADHSDVSPVWSPGGSEIGYIRFDRSRNRPAVCRTTVDGIDTRCHAFPVGTKIPDIGWRDADKIGVLTANDSARALTFTTISYAGDVSVALTDWPRADLARAAGYGPARCGGAGARNPSDSASP